MSHAAKHDYPVSDVRRFLEPGPVVLVSSAHAGKRDIMTMGWHMVMEFTPSRIGCIIAPGNHTHDLVRASRDCVINLPTADMADTVVGIGNTSGADIDKFAHFKLTADSASKVSAPLIRECHANFECVLRDDRMVDDYMLFIFEVVKAHVRPEPADPVTLHYRGHGQFMVSGKALDLSTQFKSSML